MAQGPDEVIISTPPSSESSDADDIRAQIEETRAEMSETIDAIQDRLSPGRLVTSAKETVREGTLQATGTLMEWLRSNRVPVALVSMGATGLVVFRALTRSRRRSRRSRFPTQMERIAALRTLETDRLDRRSDPRLAPPSRPQ
jgi:hypothetical protein